MGFIREYAAMGDPFSFRIPKRLRRVFTPPKFIRKLQPGRLALQAASIGAGFLPGPLGTLASYAIPQGDPDQWARAYGYDMAGDPGKKVPKRKVAAAGGRVKAARKAQARKTKGHGLNVGALAKGGLSLLQQAASVPAFQQFLPQAVSQGLALPGASGEEGPTGVVNFGGPPMPMPGAGRGRARDGLTNRQRKAMGMPLRHQRINPTNVHALRRSMRRIEGFGQLVRRVAPMIGLHVGAGSGSSARGHRRGRGMGHRAGCGCVVCKRK